MSVNVVPMIEVLVFCFSSSFLPQLMARLRHGFMILWDQGLIMMRQVVPVQPWPIVRMVQGNVVSLIASNLGSVNQLSQS